MVSIQLPILEIQYRDVFVMKFLYSVMHEWLVENNWTDITGNDDHQFMERLFLEKRIGLNEIRIWWRTIKNPLIGGSPQKKPIYRYKMNVYFRIINMSDTEVVHEGRKMKAQRGEATLFFLPQLDFDPEGEFEKHWLLKRFARYLRQRILKKQIEERRRDLIRETYQFHGMVKKYLEEHLFIPEMEVLHEKFGEI